MKKYHLADALTAIEVIMAIILLIMAILKVSADYAIWIFIIGELCDAFDGICARRWPYPNDGKYRWWREPNTVAMIEHSSDIILGLACASHLCIVVSPFYGTLLLAIMGLFALVVEVILQDLFSTKTSIWFFHHPDQATKLILFRRKCYLVSIALAILLLIHGTSWPRAVKFCVCIIGGLIGGWLYAKKKPSRLDQV